MSEILVLLIAAVTVVSVFRFFKASPIHGYLMAGLLIGPHALAFISNTKSVHVLGEFGVVFLLFTLGLKMPLHRLQVLRRYVFGLGFLQVFITGVLLTLIAVVCGLPTECAIVIGTALSLSSTAVAMQVLGERGEFAQRYGRVSFAILLSQDLAVIMLLILHTKLVGDSSSIAQDLVLAAVKVLVVLVSIILIGRLVLRPLYRLIARFDNPELFVAFTLLVILVTSLVTEALGLSMELGAFLAGLLLSETEYRHQVEADIQPFYGLLLGLFFMSVGMNIDVGMMLLKWKHILLIMSGMLALKVAVIFTLCRLFKVPNASAIRVGLLLAPGGEFVFVLLAPAMHMSLITPELSQLLYAVVVVSMALTPFLAMLGKIIAERWLEHESDLNIKSSASEVGDLKNHVIIGGFGRVGKLVVKLLTEQMIPFVIIDNDMAQVSEGHAQGLPVFYGDARRVGVMRALGAAKARAAVICLHGNKAAVQSALMFRRQFPEVNVSVRLRNNEYEQKLTEAGVHVIVPENLEPSLRLASAVLEALGRSAPEVNQVLENFRKAYLTPISEKDESEGLTKALQN